jgi:multidrug efflux pump subunit AcrA (membrane-fusion protein)
MRLSIDGLPIDRRRRGNAVLAIAAVLTIVVAAVAVGYFYFRGQRVEKVSAFVQQVSRSDFIHDVVEAGEIESSENVEVRCEVKSRNGTGTSILEVVPEGTMVQQGDIIVKLDSSALEQQLLQEQIILNNKEALMIQAENLWEAAKLAKTEYLEGTFKQEEQLYQAEAFVAEENLRRAQQYARYSERLAAKGYVTALQLESDRFAVEKAKKDLQAAQTKLGVLQNYTQQKMLRQLESDIRSAEAAYRSEQSSFELQKKAIAEFEEQIKLCTIRAPKAGQVVHANERDRRGDSEFVVQPGALLRERQVIVRLPNSTQMQVKTKVSESKIALIREGMKASVTIDAFEDMTLDGIVTKVNEYPEPTGWFNSTVKEYVTFVKIVNPPKSLKTGLTAKVRIHTQFIPKALQVPIQAIHRHQGRYYCMVRNGEGWKPQPVTLGSSNEKFVVISDGLSEQDFVALNPVELLDQVQLPEAPPPDGEMVADAGSPAAAVVVENAAPPAALNTTATTNESAPAAVPPAAPNPAAIATAIFTRGDANKDGVLTQDELPEQFRDGFAQTDANGDGSIDQSELTTAMTRRMQERAAGQSGPSGAEE